MLQQKALYIMLFLMLGLAACSSASASGGPGQPTMLHITRTETLPGYNFAPLDVTIRDVTTVQQLYQEAYALPHPPSGFSYCPNEIGLVYDLEFSQDGTSVEQMQLDATGCEWLRIGHNDVRLSNDAFRELLRKALGIPSLVPPIPGRGQP